MSKKPMIVKCMDCHHLWPVAYTPMPMLTLAEILTTARCPSCGAKADRIDPAPAPADDTIEAAMRLLRSKG